MLSPIEIPSGINSNGNLVTFQEIHGLFSDTNNGKKLASEIRYKRYNLNDLSNKDWKNMLGGDVNNLDHIFLTYGISRAFIKYCPDQFTTEEQENLLLAADVHDWGESVIKDITSDKKTAADEEVELIAIKNIATNIFGQLEDSELLARINFVKETIIKDSSTKMGQAFNAVERLGYLRTGLNAWQDSICIDETEIKEGLIWLTNNVLLNQIPKLIEYSEIYPAVKIYLHNTQDIISHAFNNLPNSTFDNYEVGDDRNNSIKKYENAKTLWQSWSKEI